MKTLIAGLFLLTTAVPARADEGYRGSDRTYATPPVCPRYEGDPSAVPNPTPTGQAFEGESSFIPRPGPGVIPHVPPGLISLLNQAGNEAGLQTLQFVLNAAGSAGYASQALELLTQARPEQFDRIVNLLNSVGKLDGRGRMALVNGLQEIIGRPGGASDPPALLSGQSPIEAIVPVQNLIEMGVSQEFFGTLTSAGENTFARLLSMNSGADMSRTIQMLAMMDSADQAAFAGTLNAFQGDGRGLQQLMTDLQSLSNQSVLSSNLTGSGLNAYTALMNSQYGEQFTNLLGSVQPQQLGAIASFLSGQVGSGTLDGRGLGLLMQGLQDLVAGQGPRPVPLTPEVEPLERI